MDPSLAALGPRRKPELSPGLPKVFSHARHRCTCRKLPPWQAIGLVPAKACTALPMRTDVAGTNFSHKTGAQEWSRARHLVERL